MNKEVYKLSLGSITVRLRNKANVCEAFLDDIFYKSELDNRELLLILDDKNGFQYDENRRRACALPSLLFDQNLFPSGYNATKNVTITRKTDLYCRDMEIIDLQQRDEWDAVVYVPKITTEKWKYKPYFAFVLGHELEHVRVIRENLAFHMCASWLFLNNYNIFEEAGIDCKSKKKWNFPLELHCNKKGKTLATNLFGKEEFDKCLKALREDKNETQKHKENLAFIMDELEGEPYTDSIWESICCDIRAYYKNILKKAAHKIWKQHQSDEVEAAKMFDLCKFLPM